MAEQPKRMILAKGHCGTCQSPVSVEVEEPAPLVKVETAPCKCGKTENERVSRWIAFIAVTLITMGMGTCTMHDYFLTQQIKSVAEKYQVRDSKSEERFGPDNPK